MQKRRPVMLVVLDGWGWREETADNAVAPGQHAGVRPAMGDRAARLSAHLTAAMSACRRADGQFRGGAPQHRRRPRGDAGPAAHRRRDRTGEITKAPALIDLIDSAQAERRHLPSHRPRLARRRAFAPGSRRGAGENPRRCRRADRGARHHRRPRHAAAIGRRRSRAIRRRAAEVGPDRDRDRPLLRDGPRQALGARGQGLQRHRRGRRPALSRCRRPPSPTPTPNSSSTNSSCRP